MARTENWEGKLHDFMQKYSHGKFRWGHRDCVVFGNEVIKLLTGIDLRQKSKHKWKSKRDVNAINTTPGRWLDLVEIALNEHFNEINPKLAQRGDVVVIPTQDGPGMGIIYAGKVTVLAREGLLYMPVSSAIKAWRIA